MVHQAIDRGRCRHRVFENPLPFGKGQIAGKQHTASFVAFCQQRKNHFHFLTRLPDVAQVVDDHPFVTGILLDLFAQLQIAFGDQQFLHQHLAGGEEDPMAFSHQFLAYRLQQVRLAAPRISKNQNILRPLQKTAVQQGPHLPRRLRRQPPRLKRRQ